MRAAICVLRRAAVQWSIRLFMNIPWDRIEEFSHPETGELRPEWAVSTVGSTTFEMSMRDERICKEVPREEWLPVMLSNRTHARIFRVGQDTRRTVTVIFGFGSPNDPIGNLMLVRVHFDTRIMAENPHGPDAEHFAKAVAMISHHYLHLGLKNDPDFYEKARRN